MGTSSCRYPISKSRAPARPTRSTQAITASSLRSISRSATFGLPVAGAHARRPAALAGRRPASEQLPCRVPAHGGAARRVLPVSAVGRPVPVGPVRQYHVDLGAELLQLVDQLEGQLALVEPGRP